MGRVTATSGPEGTAVAPDEGSSGFAPVKVLVVDEESRPGHVSTAHPAGGRYGAVWMLVRRFGRPVGIAKVPTSERDLTAQQLDPVIDEILVAASCDGPVSMHGEAPLITIIIPTVLERQEELRQCVESLAALDYPCFEILVVDNRPVPTAPVPQWLSEVPNLRILHERRPGISAARNRGLEAAAGSIVAFTDDDVIVDPGWARAIAAPGGPPRRGGGRGPGLAT